MRYKDLIFDTNKYYWYEYDSITEDYSGRKGRNWTLEEVYYFAFYLGMNGWCAKDITWKVKIQRSLF